MKITVMGCGWLGKPLAKALINKQHVVIGTTTSASKIDELEALGIKTFLFGLPVSEEPTALSHEFSQTDWLILTIPPSSIRENYAEELVRAAALFSTSTKVIFTSSTSVYDDINQEVDENTEFVGNSVRGKTIHAAENALRKSLGDRLTILRLGGLFGGDRHPVKFMVGRFILEGQTPVNMAHLDTCIQTICAVIKQNKTGEVINVCEPEHPSKEQFYTHAAIDLGLNPPEFGQEIGAHKIVNTDKLKQLLKM